MAALGHPYDGSDSVDGSSDPAGSDRLRGNFHQLQELKQLYPKLRVLISCACPSTAKGGWE